MVWRGYEDEAVDGVEKGEGREKKGKGEKAQAAQTRNMRGRPVSVVLREGGMAFRFIFSMLKV